MALDPLFDQHKCPVPYVPKVDFRFIDDCDILPAPPPVFDCPDIEIPPQVAQPPILPPDIEIPLICIPCPDIQVTASLTLACDSQRVDIGVTTFGDSCTDSPSCQFAFDFNFAIPALPCPRLTAAGTVSVAKEGEEPGVDVIVTAQQPSGSCASNCAYHLDFNFTIPVPSSLSVDLPSDSVILLCPEFTTHATAGYASAAEVMLGITGDSNCHFDVDIEVLFPSEGLSIADCPQFAAHTSVRTGTGGPAVALMVTPAERCAFDFDFDLQLPCPTITAGGAVIETGSNTGGDIIVTNDLGSAGCGATIDINLVVPPALGPVGPDGGPGGDGLNGQDGLDCVDYSCYGGYAPCQLWIWCNCQGQSRWVKPDGNPWMEGDPPEPEAGGRMYGEAKITCFCECISSSSISSVSLSSESATQDPCDCPVFRVRLSGVTCTEFNREWPMSQTASAVPCSWTQDNLGTSATLSYDGGADYVLVFTNGSSTATYTKSAETFDVDGCNTMILTGVVGSCSGWPPEVRACCEHGGFGCLCTGTMLCDYEIDDHEPGSIGNGWGPFVSNKYDILLADFTPPQGNPCLYGAGDQNDGNGQPGGGVVSLGTNLGCKGVGPRSFSIQRFFNFYAGQIPPAYFGPAYDSGWLPLYWSGNPAQIVGRYRLHTA